MWVQFIFLFASGIQPFLLPSACNETIQAGPDQVLCYPGGTVDLNGFFSGNEISSLEWTPAAGLSDPFVLDPAATVTQTTTYTLTIKAPSGNNLIINGDFEAGNTGFSSNYWYGNPGLSPGGYSVQSNPVVCNGGFSQCGDHTSGSGNMMVIDGSTTPGITFFCQTVPVNPNTDYYFEFYITSVYPVSPANVQATFNGIPVGSVSATGNTCEWIQFSTVWNSGGASSVTICLEDLNIIGGGNDFAIDDVFLREICEYEDEVTITVLDEIVETQSYEMCFGESIEVGGQYFDDAGDYDVVLSSFLGCDSTIQVHIDVADVEAYILQADPLNCYQDQTSLDGSLSVGSNGIGSFTWTTTGGVILSNPLSAAITIGGSGTYQLLVSTTLGSITCYDSVSIDVPMDTLQPLVSIDTPPFLSCQDSTLQLVAIANPLPGSAFIEWDTPDGMILNGQNSLNPLIQGPGMYIIAVTDPANGCMGLDTTFVLADTSKPVIQPIGVPDLTCRDTVSNIQITIPSPAFGVTLQWSTFNGLILNGIDSTILSAGTAGTYTLVATDTLSGCTSTWTTSVIEDKTIPAVQLPLQDTLGCQQTEIQATALVPSGPDSLSISWYTANGSFNSPTDSLVVLLGGEGDYLVLVENLANGCLDSAAITIVRNEILPNVDAGPDLVLDCLQDTALAISLGSDQGLEFDYQWTTTSGSITGDTLLQPVFSAAGTYILTILNTQNLCSDTDTLEVTDIRSFPLADIQPALTLTCADPTIPLDGSASDQGHHLHLWTGPGTIQNPGTLLPEVQSPGWFTLTVTDTINHCQASDSILVMQDIAPPISTINPPDSLDCNHPSITLDASASAPGGQLNFQWSTGNGNIVSGATTATPSVSGGGIYTILITNTANGCSTFDSVFVYQDPDLPVVSILPADTLTCLVNQLDLTATYQSPNPNVTFQWSTVNGQILNGGTTLSPEIGKPGIYSLVLTDPTTGCTATDEVLVVENTAVPMVDLPDSGPLTCSVTLIDLLAVPVNDNGTLTWAWSTADGQFVGQTQGNPVSVNASGTYQVIWTVPENGCTGSGFLVVQENVTTPTADAGPDAKLPCDPPVVMLDGTGSSGQGGLSYTWSSPDGQIASGALTAQPEVNVAGHYTLIVTDPVNGCTAVDTVVISQSIPSGMTYDLVPPGCRRAQGEFVLLGSAGGTPPYQFTVDSIQDIFTQGEGLLLNPGPWSITILDALGCSFDTLIIMPDREDLQLVVPQEVWVNYGDSGLIELNINFPATQVDTILWNPNIWLTSTSDPLVWYTHAPLATQYQVTVETIDGCEAKGVIQVLIDNDPVLFVPNVFSPNEADGINDRFYPFARPGTVNRIVSMGVYDRWGTRLFYREDFPPDDESYGWDGTFRQNSLNPAVFIWVIKAELNTGEVVLLKGDVTLL